MSVRKATIKSDLAKLDTHRITSEEYKEIPELTDAWFDQADVYHGDKLLRKGVRSATVQLDEDILKAFRSSGLNWETDINNALRQWLKEHQK